MQAARNEDAPYEGTLSSLTRYGTLNTPSLKTGHERRGKAKCKRNPRLTGPLGQGRTSDVTVYHRDKPEERYVVPASFYSRGRSYVGTKHVYHGDATAELQARQDHRLDLLRRAGNASDVD
jgi:hypothetical protein